MSFGGSQPADLEESKELRNNYLNLTDFYMAPVVDYLSYEPNFLFKESAKE